MSDKDWKKEALALAVLLRAKCSEEEWANMESRFACTVPAPQPDDLLQTIRYLLMSWSVFYAKLPDGEYDGLGEMRTALANIKDVEVRLAATPQVTPCDHFWRTVPVSPRWSWFTECEKCKVGAPLELQAENYGEGTSEQASTSTGISLDGGKTIHSKFKND